MPTLVSSVEYLSTSFRPDRELVDGHLIERNVGDTNTVTSRVRLSRTSEAGNWDGASAFFQNSAFKLNQIDSGFQMFALFLGTSQ